MTPQKFLFFYLQGILSRNNTKRQKFLKIQVLPKNLSFWHFYKETIRLKKTEKTK